jgi:orotidine-5'-phosphate decarboxylase
MPGTKLIVALDTPDLKGAELILKKLEDLPLIYKIGSSLFTLAGPRAVDMVHKYGGRVFLDLKFHDIPNTARNAVESAARLGVYSVSLHLSGGTEMLQAAAALKKKPLLWGITVLTSFDRQSFSRAGFKHGIERTIIDLAGLGAKNGADGLVCSPHEAAALKKRFGARLKIITPGIRLESGGSPALWPPQRREKRGTEDQKRVMTPAQAAEAGADFIVVGRPVLQAADPALAALEILEAIQ